MPCPGLYPFTKLNTMRITKQEIKKLDKIKRINLINSITGLKPANLIGTVDDKANSNLAIFSSIVHLGSTPPLIGMITRPIDEVPRHTYANILSNTYYTINHVPNHMTEQAHQTSAKYSEGISEFEACGFTEEYLDGFAAPYVRESNIKIGMKHVQSIPIELNGTILCIGEIQHIILPEDNFSDEGYIDLESAQSTGISGLNSYYKLSYVASYGYARVKE